MTFYIDVILLENIIMNYIILFATGLIIKIKVNHTRLIISSLIGTVYAIMSYISKINVYTNQLVKLLLSVAMIYIAYNPDNLKKLFKDGVIFYLTSFCFGGAAYYLLYYISPQQIKNIGRTLTGSYPVKIAISGGILGFFLINIAFKIIKNKVDKNSIIYNIEIFYKNKSVKTKMLLDTGNLLVEPLTSFPVVIIEKEKMEGMLKGEDLEIISNGIINRFDEISEELRNSLNLAIINSDSEWFSASCLSFLEFCSSVNTVVLALNNLSAASIPVERIFDKVFAISVTDLRLPNVGVFL